MKTALVIWVIGVAGMLLLAGCSDTGHGDAETTATVNGICPIMNQKIDRDKVPASLTLDFEGKKVGFCCVQCVGKWKTLSDADKRAKLTAVTGSNPPPGTSDGHKEHDR